MAGGVCAHRPVAFGIRMTEHPFDAPPHPDLDAEALDWFVRHSHAPHDAQADAPLQAWLSGRPDRQAAYARWQADWRRLDALPASGVAQLRRQLAADKARQQPAGRPTWAGGLSALAARASSAIPALLPRAALATAVLSVAGATGWLAFSHWQQQPLFVQDFSTERGQQLNVQLPDGSRLRLDTATRVEVALYRQRREVRLPQGQAVFQVQGDAARPFDVLAGGVKVTVVGTQFSVRHTDGEPVQVAVQEGRVRVTATQAASADGAQPPATVLLAAGQQVAADAGGLQPVAAVPAAGIAPWRDGRISFDNVPLARALAEFERYGATGLTVRDPAVAALRLSGTFDPRRLDNFRRALPKVLPVRLQADGAQTEIVSSH